MSGSRGPPSACDRFTSGKVLSRGYVAALVGDTRACACTTWTKSDLIEDAEEAWGAMIAQQSVSPTVQLRFRKSGSWDMPNGYTSASVSSKTGGLAVDLFDELLCLETNRAWLLRGAHLRQALLNSEARKWSRAIRCTAIAKSNSAREMSPFDHDSLIVLRMWDEQ